MQTFLPSESFLLSARCLDNKRLWKQCVEAKQLLLGQFPNHPASKMWRGYSCMLAVYGFEMCEESIRRGIAAEDVKEFFLQHIEDSSPYPPWLGDDRLHSSHRSNLLRKDYDYYSKFNWSEHPNIPYYWPV